MKSKQTEFGQEKTTFYDNNVFEKIVKITRLVRGHEMELKNSRASQYQSNVLLLNWSLK
jgi:hypothetical protein